MSTHTNYDNVSLREFNNSSASWNLNRIRSASSITSVTNTERATHLCDDVSLSGTVSRRKFDQQSSILGSRCSAPVLTIDKDGTTTIEMDIMNDDNGFYVRWTNLCYTVQLNWFERLFKGPQSKTILNNLNGFFLSGELIALMGPSGAGKTTLLECLCLRKRERISGDIIVVGKPKVRIAFVPQHDDLLPQFTVSETIFYASRYKNRTYDISHRNIVRRVIQQLGLEICQNNSITRCSGGQRKRVAIAQELVKRPNILILDEPTSGLDSSSCSQTIGVLRQIIDSSSSPLAIVTTIHQPSARVMSLFDRIHLLASGGRLAYNGSPANIVPTLKSIECPCPPFYNPIDHLIEVVAGDYGKSKVDRLIGIEQSKKFEFNARLEAVSAQSLRKAILYDPCPTEDHIKIHTQRCTIQLIRDPVLFSFRIILHFIMAVFFSTLWGYNIGRGAACPTFNKQSVSPISIALSANLTKEEQADLQRVNDTILFTIYSGMFSMYASIMITVLSFPLDVKVLSKEYYNGWYSVTTYLVGKITADTPFQIVCVTMFAAIAYFLTQQPSSDYCWRFIVYAYSLNCLSLISQTQGLIVGAIFMKSLAASVFIGPLTITPVFLFSGFARRYSRMADYLKPLVKMSYFHHALRTIFASLYGFGRCRCYSNDYQLDLSEVDYEDINSITESHPPLSSESTSSIDLADTTHITASYIGQFRCDNSFKSLVMHELGIDDNDMYFGMGILMAYLIVMRGFVLLLLMYRVKR